MPAPDPNVQEDLTKLFLSLAHNPKTRKSIAKAVREIAPDSPHAQAFSDVDVEDKFEAFKREQEQKDIKRQQDEVLAGINRKRSALLTGGPDGSGRKYGEDDLKKIETLMQSKGIVDYDDGAVLYAATLPPIDNTPSNEMPTQTGATWEFPEWSKFGVDPNKAARDTANSVISEFMRKR